MPIEIILRKSTLISLFLFLLFFVTSTKVKSQIATENFDYAAGTSIDGLNGGTGYGTAWDLTPLNGSFEMVSGSLSNPTNQGTGNKLRVSLINETATKYSTRDLAFSYQNGTEMWMSCLIRPIDVADGGFWIKPNDRQDIAIGKRWGTQLAIDNNGSSTNVVANTTYKLVVRYKLENNQTVAHLWIDRDDSFTDANADATKTVGSISEISSISIAMERWGDGIMDIDELKFGCNAASLQNDCIDSDLQANVGGNPTICPGESIILTSSGNLGVPPYLYEWSTGDMTQNITVNPSVQTDYTVTVTDQNNCEKEGTVSVFVDNNLCAPVCNNLLAQQSNLVLGKRDVIVIRGVDPATHTWSDTDAELATFETELDQYVQNVSFGKAWTGSLDITPVYNFTVDPNNNGYYQMGLTLKAIAEANGYNVNDYNVVIYIHQSTTDFGGAGALGGGNGLNGSVYANNSLTWYYPGNIHETFHAFGTGHAEGIEGGTNIYPGQVTGGTDPYHFMGSQGDAGMVSDIPNYLKYFLGWIDQNDVVCLPDVGVCETHRIYKSSLVDNYDGSRNYSIQLNNNLWISYEPDNENSQIVTKGLLLHYIPSSGSAVTRLLDVNPESITQLPPGLGSNFLTVIDFWDAAMVQGDVVNWEGIDISISAEGGAGQDKWVEVEFCDCIVQSGDSDGDGVCDNLDVCPGENDSLDLDFDGSPDACDTCPESPTDDGNNDGICDNVNCLHNVIEEFNYPIGQGLEGQNGGQGFGDMWTNEETGVPTATATIIDGNLGSQANDNTNKLEFVLDDETGGINYSRDLSPGFQVGESVWVSVNIRATDLSSGGMWFRPNGRQDIAIGKRWGTQLAIDNNGSPINMTAGQDYRLVAKYYLKSDGVDVSLWVDPTDAEILQEINPDATKSGGPIQTLTSFNLRLEKWGAGDYEIDNFKVDCAAPVQQVTLPVHWMNFTADDRSTFHDLNWSTAVEINTSYFVVERALNNTNDFEELATIEAAGNSATAQYYNYQDYDILKSGLYIYRLRQVDLNGSHSFSDIVVIRKEKEFDLSIFPNPASDVAYLKVNILKDQNLKVNIWSSDGRLVRRNLIQSQIESGNHKLELDLHSLEAGMYQVEIILDNMSYKRKLILAN